MVRPVAPRATFGNATGFRAGRVLFPAERDRCGLADYNVIAFESISPQWSKLTSYGLGYGNDDRYAKLLELFEPANDKLYRALIEVAPRL